MKIIELKKAIKALKEDLNLQTSSIPQEISVKVEPPKETKKEDSSFSYIAYDELEEVKPKNSRVKKAFQSSAKENGTYFLFIIEEIDKKDNRFHGRAASLCKHNGKLVYAAASFVQSANSPIPPNLFKMVPRQGATVPTWVKSYIEE